MIKIKNRYTNETIIEIESWENADLRYANLSCADLRYANLSYADLSSVNLSSADLRSVNLSCADLRYANLSYADLNCANLSSADLSSADLRSADLSSVIGNGDLIISYQSKYKCVFYGDDIYIGCQCHKISEWKSFDNKIVLEMDGKNGLKWWNQNKQIIFSIYEAYKKEG